MPGPTWALWAGGICSVSPGGAEQWLLPVCNCASQHIRVQTCTCASIGEICVNGCASTRMHLHHCMHPCSHPSLRALSVCAGICLCLCGHPWISVCLHLGGLSVCMCVATRVLLCTCVLLLFVHLCCCPFVCLSLHMHPRAPPCVSTHASLCGYVHAYTCRSIHVGIFHPCIPPCASVFVHIHGCAYPCAHTRVCVCVCVFCWRFTDQLYRRSGFFTALRSAR